LVKRRADVVNTQLDLGPRSGKQNDHRQPSTGQVLLLSHVLIGK
jgi:hypothetical protein